MALLKTVNLNGLIKYLFMVLSSWLIFFSFGLITFESFPDMNFCMLTQKGEAKHLDLVTFVDQLYTEYNGAKSIIIGT